MLEAPPVTQHYTVYPSLTPKQHPELRLFFGATAAIEMMHKTFETILEEEWCDPDIKDLGYLPVEVSILGEDSTVTVEGIPFCIVKNTDPDFPECAAWCARQINYHQEVWSKPFTKNPSEDDVAYCEAYYNNGTAIKREGDLFVNLREVPDDKFLYFDTVHLLREPKLFATQNADGSFSEDSELFTVDSWSTGDGWTVITCEEGVTPARYARNGYSQVYNNGQFYRKGGMFLDIHLKASRALKTYEAVPV